VADKAYVDPQKIPKMREEVHPKKSGEPGIFPEISLFENTKQTNMKQTRSYLQKKDGATTRK
jgi:hypothetical protein